MGREAQGTSWFGFIPLYTEHTDHICHPGLPFIKNGVFSSQAPSNKRRHYKVLVKSWDKTAVERKACSALWRQLSHWPGKAGCPSSCTGHKASSCISLSLLTMVYVCAHACTCVHACVSVCICVCVSLSLFLISLWATARHFFKYSGE